MGHYSGGTLNDTDAMRKQIRTLERRLNAANTASGSQPNQTTDKVNNINTDVQSALDAADAAQSTASQASSDATAAQSAASDAQSGVTVLTSQLAASTVLSTSAVTQTEAVADEYQLMLPGAPGDDPHAPALVTASVLGNLVWTAYWPYQLEFLWVDTGGGTHQISSYPPAVDDARTYPGGNAVTKRSVNMSVSFIADGLSVVELDVYPTGGYGGSLLFTARVDYPMEAPTAVSLMAKPVVGVPLRPVRPTQPATDAPSTADEQSTDTKEQS